jgi:hypothetical protein
MITVKSGRDIRSECLQMASCLLPLRRIQPGDLATGTIADFRSGCFPEKWDKEETAGIQALHVCIFCTS